MNTVRLIAVAAALIALGACTVNTSPPVAAAPSPVVVQQPAVAPQPNTVVVQPPS